MISVLSSFSYIISPPPTTLLNHYPNVLLFPIFKKISFGSSSPFPQPYLQATVSFLFSPLQKKTFWKSWVFWLSLISFSFRFLLDHSSQAFSPAAPSQWLLSRLSVSSTLLNPLVSPLSCSHLTYQKHSTLLIFPFSWKCSLHLTSRILVTQSRPCFSHWQLYPSSYSS